MSSRTLGDALLKKRILVCVGSGGVGKTTTAAALALAAARRGRRTLVLTIDPAKRLANSLGLEQLGHRIQKVDPALCLVGAPVPGGELHAMMLDQKQAFDEMVARYAREPAAVQRILHNPLYSQISASLAGAHEYAAMAKLEELDEAGGWDLIIVDTPPTANALDFLDAPQKLSAALDSPAIEWFRKLQSGKGGWSLVGRSGSFVLKRLAKFVGSRFLEDIGTFFTEFNDILGGFKQRADQTFSLLRQDRVGFVLVASPEPMAVQEALWFHQRLTTADMPFVGFVLNRVHVGLPLSAARDDVARLAAEAPSVARLGLSGTSLRMAAEALLGAHADLEVLAGADQETVARVRDAGGPGAIVVQVPFLREDVHDVERLNDLGRYLVG